MAELSVPKLGAHGPLDVDSDRMRQWGGMYCSREPSSRYEEYDRKGDSVTGSKGKS